MNLTRDDISEQLKRSANPRKAEWWNGYLRGVIPFLGVGIPEIRKIFLETDNRQSLTALPMNRQVSLVNGLMRGRYAEEKLAAILYMQLFWLHRQRGSFLVNLISDWFDHRLIFDWNTTDWLCVRILTPLIDQGQEEVLWKLKIWNRDPYLWKARASLVPFARADSLPLYGKEVGRLAGTLIRRKERFAKTAVGWVLREYSRHDVEFVLSFLSRNAKHLTGEVKRNALKYHREFLKPGTF